MATVHKRTFTVRAARWSATHPWRAIIGWAVFVALCFAAGSMIGTHSATSADFRVGEAGKMEQIADDGGLNPVAVENVLITSNQGPLDRTAADAAANQVTNRMRVLPEVASVAPPQASPDGTAVMVKVTMKGDQRDASLHVEPLLAQTAEVQKANPALRVEETGKGSTGKGLNDQRGSDLALSEAITLPVTLVILLLVFGSVLAAGVPVLLAITSIAGATGLYGVVSHIFPDAGVGAQVILMMGMAVGVDYALFYLKREREEREASGGRITAERAIELAAATSGRAVVMSGFAVIASTACLFFADDVIFSSLAAGTVIVILVAMVSSLTVLPAVLAKLGTRVDRRLRWRRKRDRAGEQHRLWTALLRPAMRRPGLTLLLSVGGMLLLSLPALGMKLGVPGDDTYSRSIPSLQVADRVNQAFPSERATNSIAVHSDTATHEQIQSSLAGLASSVRDNPLFAGNDNPNIAVSADGKTGTLYLGTPYNVSSPQATAALHQLRGQFVPAAFAGLPGAQYAVSGDVAQNEDYVRHQDEQLPWVLGFVLLVSFLMTLVAFRSIVIAFIGTVLTMLSATAAFGLLVLVFQGHWAENLLGFESVGFIGSRVPLFLVVILFGLSMDYQIFVVSRIREAVLAGVPTRQAVSRGIVGSASVVTSAAVVMVSVFVSFVLLHLLELKQTGFALATGVLLDAVVVRILILPSLLALLGRASWWPSRATRAAREPQRPVDPRTQIRLDQPSR
ncbi:MMPL family transporter [Amycolatopsis sp. cg13]|uniref:MMPL family transporter n=1 Tax=Amycolatopsis sp. cg13 TaxID=3238807 RepID=UPI003525C809